MRFEIIHIKETHIVNIYKNDELISSKQSESITDKEIELEINKVIHNINKGN
jgi:hypothetical protein